MKKSHKVFVFILCFSVFFVLGCDVNPEIVYPLKVTITGLPNPSPLGQEILSAGIFASPEDIMPQEVLSGEMPKEDMMQKAQAGGIAKIKDGKAVIELMDPVEQINFTTLGDYYVALMIGESMDELEAAYVFINSDPVLQSGMDAAMSENKEGLIALIEGPENPLNTLPTCYLSNNTPIDLSEFVDVTSMFHTLFGEE